MLRNYLIVVLAVSIGFLTACGEPPTYPMELGTRLKDGSYLKVNVVFEFKDPAGVEEMKATQQKFERAFKIVLREYRSSQLGDKGKGKILRVLKRLAGEMIKSETSRIQIVEYQIRKK